MSDFPKKLEAVLIASDQIIAWGLAIAAVVAVYLVAFVIGYELTGMVMKFFKDATHSDRLFWRTFGGKDDIRAKKHALYDRVIALYEKYGVYKGPRDE